MQNVREEQEHCRGEELSALQPQPSQGISRVICLEL